MVCNYQAPNGEKSALYEGLFQLIGPAKAHLAWNAMRGETAMKRTNNWELVQKDVNGEPTLLDTINLIGLGTFAHVEQHNKFVSRWSLRSVPGTFNRYFGNKALAMKMHEQLRVKSKDLYNLLEIKYDPITAHVVIIPKPILEVKRLTKPEQRTEEFSEAAKIAREQLEQSRAEALREASKPYGTLQFITDPQTLNRTVQQEVEVDGTGETLTREIKAAKWQASIRKDYEIFNKLVKCIQ